MWPGIFPNLPLMCTSDKYPICTYTCLSDNSCIPSWISIKFASVILLSMFYLWSNFQPKANIWMYLRVASTLSIDCSHNVEPKQMICIKFQIHKLCWCINLQWKFKKNVTCQFSTIILENLIHIGWAYHAVYVAGVNIQTLMVAALSLKFAMFIQLNLYTYNYTKMKIKSS